MAFTRIDYTAEDGQRFAAALGRRHQLTNGGGAPRSATEAEAKDWIIAKMRALVREVEREEAQKAIADTPWNAA